VNDTLRILVLGVGGFLGAHTAAYLRTLPGVRVLGGSRAPSAELPADLGTVAVGELTAAIARLQVAAVVNCAGATTGGALRLAEVNARGPAALCEALREAAPTARLVHIGSAAEYGAAPHGTALTETSPTCPLGAYGVSKLAGTLAVAGAPLDAVVLRVFNPIGPGTPATALPGRLAAQLRHDGRDSVVRVGDLSAYRDYVDVRDVARAAALAATVRGPLPRVVNIAAGQAVRVREVAWGLARAAGFRGSIEETAPVGSVRSAAVAWQLADIATAQRALGWRPRIALADSLRDLWDASGRPASEAVR
jgi:nucleoside-diphosphate-sugar epimerase